MRRLTRKPKTDQKPSEPEHPHPGRDCDKTCDITDEAHNYGCVFFAVEEEDGRAEF